MRATVKLDDAVAKRRIASLISRECQKLLRGSMRKGAGVLAREARRQLLSRTQAASHRNWWNGKAMTQGVQVSVGPGNSWVKVHIMGDFRLKWFEKGVSGGRVIKRYRQGRYFYDRENRAYKHGKIRGTSNKATVFFGGSFKQVGKYRGRFAATRFFTDAKRVAEHQMMTKIEENIHKELQKRAKS